MAEIPLLLEEALAEEGLAAEEAGSLGAEAVETAAVPLTEEEVQANAQRVINSLKTPEGRANLKLHAKTLLKNNLPNIVKAALGTTIGAGAGAGIEAAIKGAGDHVTQIVKDKASSIMNNTRDKLQGRVDAGRADMQHFANAVADSRQPELAQVLQNPMARSQMITDGAALIANHHPSVMNKTVGDSILGADLASRSPFISGSGTGIAGPTDLQMRRQLIADRMQKAVGDGFFDDLWDGIKGVGKSVVHGVEGLVEHPGKTLEGLATLPLQMIPGGSGLSKALGGGGPSAAQSKPSTNVYVIKEGGQKPVGDARIGLTPRNTVGKTAFNQAPSTLIQPSRALGMLPRGSMAMETPAMRNQNALAMINRKRTYAQMDAPGSDMISSEMVMGAPIGSQSTASVGTGGSDSVDKIAGDAAPPAASANTFKTVGDALPPPNDSTASDERNMAMMTHGEVQRAGGMVANSIIGRLLALLVQKEQLLDCQAYFSTGLNSVQMRGVTIQNYEQKDAVWNLTSIRFNASLPFMSCQPTAFPAESDQTHTDLAYTLSAISVVEIELEQPDISPPLASNVTYAALAPLLDGMPITEFASALRIRIRNTDVDALVNLAALTKLNFEAQTGYSFMLMLLKLMAYQSWFFYSPGNEWDQIATGVNYEVDGGNWATQDAIFPFDLKADMTNRFLTRAQYSARNLRIAVITYREMTDKLLGRQNQGARWTAGGQNRNWDPQFEPDTWTTTCAVVFVNSSEKQNYPERLTARMLTQMAYPVTFVRSETPWRSYQTTNNGAEWVDVAAASEGHIYPNGNMMHIPGPTDTVLLVMTDLEEIQQGFNLRLGATGHVVNVTWLMTPGNPAGHAVLANAIYNFLDNADVPTVIQWEIARWESRYGNASDRSSAMRVLANSLYRKGPGRFYSESPVQVEQEAMGYRQVIVKQGGAAPAPGNFPIDNVVFNYGDNSPAAAIFNNVKYGTELPIGYKMVGRTQDAAHTIWSAKTQGTTFKIGQTDAVMQLMAERGWLKPSEESPQTNLSNPARTFASIREMAEIMHAISTHLREANSISLFDYLGYGQTNVAVARDAQIDSNLAMRMKFFGPAEGIMTYGIQYPQATIDFEHMKPDNGAGLLNVNDWLLHRVTVTSWVGESHIALSKYLGAPILAETRARFNSPATYKATKMTNPDNINQQVIVDSVVPGYDDVDEVKALYGLRIWSKAALPVGAVVNPKFIINNETTGQTRRFFIAFDSPLVDAATMASYGQEGYANLFTNFPLPIIHNPIVYEWGTAGERSRYGVSGLRSSFVIPEGTPSSALFVTLNDTVSTEVSPYWSGNGQPHLFRAKTLAEFL